MPHKQCLVFAYLFNLSCSKKRDMISEESIVLPLPAGNPGLTTRSLVLTNK